MPCYKDRTYCPFNDTCAHDEDCPRALTVELQQDAKAFGLPISKFTDKPDCWEPRAVTMEIKDNCMTTNNVIVATLGEACGYDVEIQDTNKEA